MIRIACIATCHNRREKTLKCIAALTACDSPSNVKLEVLIVDDGSTDGTAAAIAARFPFVRVIRGTGSLYWNGGMHLAMTEAMRGCPDYYLWLNDDTYLFGHGLADLLLQAEALKAKHGPVIVVGSTLDEATRRTTYGGRVRTRAFRPLYYDLLEPGEDARACETMNGNCVLIPQAVAAAIGPIEPRFVHGMGDWDYALRARKAGFGVWLAPGHVAACTDDATQVAATAPVDSLRTVWRQVTGPKGYPLVAWTTFVRRHTGPLWPLYWLMPYAKALRRGLASGRLR